MKELEIRVDKFKASNDDRLDMVKVQLTGYIHTNTITSRSGDYDSFNEFMSDLDDSYGFVRISILGDRKSNAGAEKTISLSPDRPAHPDAGSW